MSPSNLPLALLAPTDSLGAITLAFDRMGWRIAQAGDPAVSSVQEMGLGGVRIFLVVLTPAIEAALEDADDVLYAGEAEILFDEMEGKESWDAGQWEKHLSPKIKALAQRFGMTASSSVMSSGQAETAIQLPEPPSLPEERAEALAFDLTLEPSHDAPLATEDFSPISFALLEDPEQAAASHEQAQPASPSEQRFESAAEDFGALSFVDFSYDPSLESSGDGGMVFPEDADTSQTPPSIEFAAEEDALPLFAQQAEAAPEANMDFGGLAFAAEDTLETPAAASAASANAIPAPAFETSLAFASDEAAPTPEPIQAVSAEDPRALVEAAAPDGLVVIVGGTGGPAALRDLLSQLQAPLPVPLVIHQDLPQGRYEVFANNMKRAGGLDVRVAQPGQALTAGVAWLLPEGQAVVRGEDQWFVQDGVVDVSILEAGASQSIVVVLSGASPQLTFPSMEALSMGAVFYGQNPDQAYEPQLIATLKEMGLVVIEFEDLAIHIHEHWGFLVPMQEEAA